MAVSTMCSQCHNLAEKGICAVLRDRQGEKVGSDGSVYCEGRKRRLESRSGEGFDR
jgi:hypothetical protein